jgi:hypothetical protein
MGRTTYAVHDLVLLFKWKANLDRVRSGRDGAGLVQEAAQVIVILSEDTSVGLLDPSLDRKRGARDHWIIELSTGRYTVRFTNAHVRDRERCDIHARISITTVGEGGSLCIGNGSNSGNDKGGDSGERFHTGWLVWSLRDREEVEWEMGMEIKSVGVANKLDFIYFWRER